MADASATSLSKRLFRSPCCIRVFFDCLVEVLKKGNEREIKIEVVVECFRTIFFLGFFAITIIGMFCTKVIAQNQDHDAIIRSVFGGSNACSYLDFPPSTYVLPMVWTFPLLCGIMYNVTSMFRIWIAYEEGKINGRSRGLLWFAHIYFIVTCMYFSTCFAVQPDREDPVTMIVHTVPYANFKLALCILQIAVVWFGGEVAWKELMENSDRCSRKVLMTLSWIHVALQLVVMIVSQIMIINALGDMGEPHVKWNTMDVQNATRTDCRGLCGKGLWWLVDPDKNPELEILWEITTNKGSFILGCIVPLIQSIYIASRGSLDLGETISKTHTVNFVVADNREAIASKDQ